MNYKFEVMEKVKKFKELCSEMEQRKKNLNEEVDIYIQKANHIRDLGGFISFDNKITPCGDKCTNKP